MPKAPPALGVTHFDHGMQLADHVGDLAVEQLEDFGIQSSFAAGVAGEMIEIDGRGHAGIPDF
jgi:hypothetical protein